jgi:hypothetical protein
MFRIDGRDHASEYEGLALAATNPLDSHRMVRVIAGNNALETVLLASKGEFEDTQYMVFDSEKPTVSGFLKTTPTVSTAQAR